MAEFLEVTQDEDAKLCYMRKNIDIDKFREVFIKSAINAKDYQEYIRVVEEVSNKPKNVEQYEESVRKQATLEEQARLKQLEVDRLNNEVETIKD